LAELTIAIPQMKKMTFVKATFWRRALAALFDAIVVSMAFYMISHFVLVADYNFDTDKIFAFGNLVFFLYHVIMESSRGQATIGKRVLNLKVIRRNNKKIDLFTAFSRNAGKLLIQFTFLQGILRLLIPGTRQAVHDQFANCYVVEVKNVT
jgi:uncharacterized RDD family membrane protein YckC